MMTLTKLIDVDISSSIIVHLTKEGDIRKGYKY